MLVSDCMTRHPIMVGPEQKAAEIQQIMVENKIRHIPIVGDGKRLLGMITRAELSLKPDLLGSLNVWEISRRLGDVTAKQIMLPRKKLHVIEEKRTVERAAAIMMEHKLDYLPVVDSDDTVVGILSEVDLLRAFTLMLGLPKKGVRITMRMPDKPGEFSKLMQVIGDQEWGVMGIGTFPSTRIEGQYVAVVKVPRITVEEARAVLGKIETQEIVDIREVI
jgi:acetoin utilization protein AcuB